MYKSTVIVTLRDIATECKVHPTTVSRALNKGKGVSEKTRRRILKVCEKRGYRPNLIARSLILKKTSMIGVLIPDITNQFYSYVSKGVSSVLDELDYGLLFCNSDRSKEKELRNIDFLIKAKVDGVIVMPTEADKQDFQAFIDYGIPFIFADNYVEDMEVSFVGNDNYNGARKIIQHMIERGFRRIGAILSDEHSTASNERLAGYIDVHREKAIVLDRKILLHSSATFESGYRLSEVLIGERVDSIFAINDTVAMGVIKRCYEKGIQIPDQIGIAGYDDIEQSAMLPVPLTTVRQNKYYLGRKAAEVLINEINNPNARKQKIILHPELITRKSCRE